MKGNTGFLKKFITCVYDINAFSKYAKEGLLKSIIYILVLCTGVGIVKGGVLGYKINQGVNTIIEYLESEGNNTYIENGLLNLDSNIVNANDYIYLDTDKTIDDEIDYKNIFYNSNIDLVILKDGIAFDNYGSIYALNYSDIFKEKDINFNTVISKAKIFSIILIVVIMVLNIIEVLKDLIFNCLVVVTAALIVSTFMRMVVKYKALWSIVIYASTMPLIIVTIINLLKPNIDFDFTFIGGTLTYIILILKHIRDEIIEKLSNKKY